MPKHIGPWCKHYQENNMPENHRCDAKLALIAEAPGRREDEDQFGRPLIGPSGFDLQEWWKEVGLEREDFYIDNVYPERPPDNKLHLIPKPAIDQAAAKMLRRLRRQDCNVVVACGNYSLRYILGETKRNISDWRGSILPWDGRKLIPTFHPAITQRQKVLTKLCKADWVRIAEESRSRQLWIPQRDLVIDPTKEERNRWFQAARQNFQQPSELPKVLSVDVENVTTGDRHLTCIGLSFHPLWSITVGTIRADYGSQIEFEENQEWLVEVLKQGWDIVGQNFMTDLWKLVWWRRELREVLQRSYVWDLIEMAHLLDPNDGGGTEEGSEDEEEGSEVRVGMLDLATLTSLYTRQPYYKHLGSSYDWSLRRQYNGLDCCVTREIFDVLWKKLKIRNLV